MRLTGGDDNRRSTGRGFRIATLSLIAMFANLSLPTQAALPEHAARDWMAPLSDSLAARFSSDNPVSPELNAAAVAAHVAKLRLRLNEERAQPVTLFPEKEVRASLDPVSGKIGRWWAVGRGLNGAPAAVDPDRAVLRGFQAVSLARLAGAAPARPGLGFDLRTGAPAIAPAPYNAAKVVWSPMTVLSAPPLRKGDHAWMRSPLPAHVFSAKQQACLATAIYFEARGESRKGQAAVAQVILNRVRNPAYPDTTCGVVYQNASQRNRCQFSFACDGVADKVTRKRAYSRAEEIAMAVTSGETFVAEIGSSTHYFANYVRPKWAGSMEKMASIGDHHFFRTRNGGWR